MTRRDALLLSLACPAYLRAAAPFWDAKDPKDWTDAERTELLTKSPWAHSASVHYDQGPGGLNRGPATSNTRRGSRGGPGLPTPDGTPTLAPTEALVRWESALPVREADRNRSKDDPAANYILSVTGDLPMLGEKANKETEADIQARSEALKQHTRLQKKGDAIYLARIAPGRESGTLFYFDRNDLLRLSDHQVTFVTRLGPIDVKAKFTLKDMIYHGKLEL